MSTVSKAHVGRKGVKSCFRGRKEAGHSYRFDTVFEAGINVLMNLPIPPSFPPLPSDNLHFFLEGFVSSRGNPPVTAEGECDTNIMTLPGKCEGGRGAEENETTPPNK